MGGVHHCTEAVRMAILQWSRTSDCHGLFPGLDDQAKLFKSRKGPVLDEVKVIVRHGILFLRPTGAGRGCSWGQVFRPGLVPFSTAVQRPRSGEAESIQNPIPITAPKCLLPRSDHLTAFCVRMVRGLHDSDCLRSRAPGAGFRPVALNCCAGADHWAAATLTAGLSAPRSCWVVKGNNKHCGEAASESGSAWIPTTGRISLLHAPISGGRRAPDSRRGRIIRHQRSF